MSHAETDLRVQIPCPQCGAPTDWSLLQILQKCVYCGSALWWPFADDVPEFFMAENGVHHADDVIDVLIRYEALRLAGIMRSAQAHDDLTTVVFDDAIPEDVWARARARRHLFQVHEWHLVYAPYMLHVVTLCYRTLGRDRDRTRKVYRPFCFLLQTPEPAYPRAWNFRDRGLRMSRDRLLPLTSSQADLRVLMAPVERVSDTQDVLRPWMRRRQVLQPFVQPIWFDAQPIIHHRWIVYRPYIWTVVRTPQGTETLIIDGAHQMIAGRPRPDEMQRIRARAWSCLRPDRIRTVRVHVLPIRCPECAWEVDLRPNASFAFCTNCGRLLQPSPQGFHVLSYQTVAPRWIAAKFPRTHPDGWVWLPFWRCAWTWTMDGSTTTDLIAYWQSLGMRGLRGEAALPIRHGWVPAMDTWIYARYAEWMQELARWLTLQAPPLTDRRLVVEEPVDHAAHVVLPALEATPAAQLLESMVPAYLPDTVQMRMNPILLRSCFQRSMRITDQHLVYVPIPRTRADHIGDQIWGPGGPIAWSPLRDGTFPPALHRTLRGRL